MKKFLIGLGAFLIIASFFSLRDVIFDYATITDYGRGFVWGKVMLFLIGLALLFWGLRKRS
jgi:hypothetical protein